MAISKQSKRSPPVLLDSIFVRSENRYKWICGKTLCVIMCVYAGVYVCVCLCKITIKPLLISQITICALSTTVLHIMVKLLPSWILVVFWKLALWWLVDCQLSEFSLVFNNMKNTKRFITLCFTGISADCLIYDWCSILPIKLHCLVAKRKTYQAIP